ncbi:hypothetical protein TNCT_89781 [Trichonephila clavata]|uniref:G-protein coupled receptors family 1 profile domain-containing protein n=1 Tax=Trichonephila clavata TaxID=2740835 RepID=A0A8X6KYI9_TRICU|nr:hypothetical protein TNCT_89781 [Trichonephila clavata]
MIASDVINASAGLLRNTTNYAEILQRKKFALDHNLCNDWFLFYVTVFSAFGHAISLLVHTNTTYRRSETWYCMVHYLVVGLANGFLPMLSKINMECYISFGEEAFEPLKYFRTFLLTLHTYTLVVFAMYAYNLVFKTLMPTPAPRSKVYGIMVCLYAISALPCLFLYASHMFHNSEETTAFPYYIYTWQFTYYPGAIVIGILLTLSYVIPVYLMYYFCKKVCIELWTKPDYDEYGVPIYALMPESDHRFISMAYTVCLSYLSTNVPFVIHELMVLFLSPEYVNATVSCFVELLSVSHVCMYPFLYLTFELAGIIVKYMGCEEEIKTNLVFTKEGIRVCTCYERPLPPEITRKDLGLLLKSIRDRKKNEYIMENEDIVEKENIVEKEDIMEKEDIK